jgi:hypothetical protein
MKYQYFKEQIKKKQESRNKERGKKQIREGREEGIRLERKKEIKNGRKTIRCNMSRNIATSVAVQISVKCIR